MKTFIFLTVFTISTVLAYSDESISIKFGRTNSFGRIVQGKPAIEKQFPWQVLLIPFRNEKSTYCGGSIISENWILTAGHCVYEMTSISLYFGSSNMDNMLKEIKSTEWILHSKYDSLSLINDVALIRLPEPLEFSETIQPVQLLSKTEARSNFFGQKAYISGFGYYSDEKLISKNLQYTNVRIIGNSECLPYYGSEIVIDSTMCARGFNNNGESTCSGDSGGPMVIENDKYGFVQIGVISFVAYEGCSKGIPSGYSRLGSYLDWIHEKTDIPLRV